MSTGACRRTQLNETGSPSFWFKPSFKIRVWLLRSMTEEKIRATESLVLQVVGRSSVHCRRAKLKF
jgi:hypothetical protein